MLCNTIFKHVAKVTHIRSPTYWSDFEGACGASGELGGSSLPATASVVPSAAGVASPPGAGAGDAGAVGAAASGTPAGPGAGSGLGASTCGGAAAAVSTAGDGGSGA